MSEDLGSQLEPSYPDSQSGSWGSRRVSGCSETPQGAWAGLGQAGSAYKWPWRVPHHRAAGLPPELPPPSGPSDSGLCLLFLIEAGRLPRQDARVLGWGE